MNSRPLISLFLSLSLVWAAPARAAIRELLADGSADMYWISRIEQDSGSGAPHSFIQSRRIAVGEQWKLIAHLNQRTKSMTHRGSQLVVLLENGDWMFLWEGGSSSGIWPEDGSKLIQLATAAGRDPLWAIASSGLGRRPTTAGATQPAASLPPAIRLLERLEAGRWKMLAPLPNEAQRGEFSLVVFDGRPMIVVLSPPEQAPVSISAFTWNDQQRDWRSAGTVAVSAGSSTPRIKLLGDLDRPALWASNDNGGELAFFNSSNGQWSEPRRLEVPSASAKGAFVDAAVAGHSIRVILANGTVTPPASGQQKIQEFSFTPDLASRGPSVIPLAAAPSDQSPGAADWLSLVATALLMMVLLNSMRRRGPLPAEEFEARRLRLAPFGRRLVAGIIDALPFIGTLVVVAMRLGPDESADPEQAFEAMKIPAYIAFGVYVLLTLASESLWGWTIGKRLMGLRVVMIDGVAPTTRAVLLRNLLRIVDVSILPLVLILITPLRQRGGDIAAETMVVTSGGPTEAGEKQQ